MQKKFLIVLFLSMPYSLFAQPQEDETSETQIFLGKHESEKVNNYISVINSIQEIINIIKSRNSTSDGLSQTNSEITQEEITQFENLSPEAQNQWLSFYTDFYGVIKTKYNVVCADAVREQVGVGCAMAGVAITSFCAFTSLIGAGL